MGMDATVVLISKNEEMFRKALSEFDVMLKSHNVGEDGKWFSIRFVEETKHGDYFVAEYEGRKTYLYEIHEMMLSKNNLYLLDDVVLVYWNDSDDEIKTLTSREDCKGYYLGNWWFKEIDVPSVYDGIPIKDIILKIWEN